MSAVPRVRPMRNRLMGHEFINDIRAVPYVPHMPYVNIELYGDAGGYMRENLDSDAVANSHCKPKRTWDTGRIGHIFEIIGYSFEEHGAHFREQRGRHETA